MVTQIQMRRGTAAQWTSTNPTLAAGEYGYETDTKKFKIGDGATVWNSLVYVYGATQKRSIFLGGSGGWSSTTAGAPAPTIFTETAGKQNFKGIPFIYHASDLAYQEFGVIMPPNWDLGTITATPYFITAGTDASNHTIIFALQAWAWSNGDTLTQTWAGEQTSTTVVASSIANKMTIGATTAAITVGGTPSKNDFVQFRTWRAVGTNTSTPVYLLGWLITYGTNNFSDE
jgi:hypothetical protein